ncbi:SPOR domain-containing protein [Vibrio ostreicida]|uniref:SPOR domain-containing protein n=1 Tax=Vibrio ostreicida TaxID=526588 RepID=UPI001FE368DE|nr:SPOR domain-containing protein [Vibrio ostreicida]
MENRMVVKAKRSLVKLLSLTVLMWPVLSFSVNAEAFLCDATQTSNDSLPLLDSDCPIGQGMWGKHRPNSQAAYFWIQCGVYAKPLSLMKAKSIYPHISSDVWAKKEGRNYRCLIGPYKDYTQAKLDLTNVKTMPEYREAFIRQVIKASIEVKDQRGITARQSAKPVSQAPSVLPALIVPAPDKVSQPLPSTEREIDIRQYAKIRGVEYKVPYIKSEEDQFYMEHDKPWNRMDYKMADNTCSRMGMRLAIEAEWQALLDADVMGKEKWPSHLPYWGEGRKGLFYSGKVTNLKGTSLLNIVCVK